MISMALLLLSIIYFAPKVLADIGSNEGCPRIRKSWLHISTEERELYISGLLKLREESHFNPDIDKFLNVADAHSTDYAALTHKASNFLFWHGYLTWEMESRIRALGGEYACFGMPYWDFTKEVEEDTIDDPMILHTGLGGVGNPDDCWAVNDYSWDVSTEQYWLPIHCCAEGDVEPVCSFKRGWTTDPDIINVPDAKEMGQGLRDRTSFIEFSKWYQIDMDNPVMMLKGITFDMAPTVVSVSYDPMWYLYHSFVEYQRFMWEDCHEYDKIDPSQLDKHPEAYDAYCIADECTVEYDANVMDFDEECLNMKVHSPMCFADVVKDKAWSYVHDHDLSVAEFYHMTKLNVVFDISHDDEHSFYVNSGMKDYCKDRLNETWWITETDETNKAQIESRSNLYFMAYEYMSSDYKYWKVLMLIVFVLLVVFAIYSLYRGNVGKSVLLDHPDHYGTF